MSVSQLIAGALDTRQDIPKLRGGLYQGDCLELLRRLPDNVVSTIVTSPPYNIGKAYEHKVALDEYLADKRTVISECVRVLKEDGSLFWQVGNHVDDGELFPLDIYFYPIFKSLGLRMRNRIVWSFPHGLHCSNRLSGRYEVVLWFTKSDRYYFDLDAIRVPQKWPQKRGYRGPRKGELTCNPLGKNPGDVWDITNVKHRHPEKTDHPCQFPEELVRRLLKATTREGDLVLDPYAGSGTTLVVAGGLGRIGLGAEINAVYARIAKSRLHARNAD